MSAGHGTASGTGANRAVRLVASPSTAGRARAFVVETLLTWQVDPHVGDDAELIVSELVTNAFLHGRAQEVAVELADLGASVRIAVTHHEQAAATGPLAPLTVGADDTHGRGLAIVDVLSGVWGVEEDGDARRVWADLVADRTGVLAVAERDAAIAELALALRGPTAVGGVGDEVIRWARVRLGVSFAGIALHDDDRPDQLRFLVASPPLATAEEARFTVTAARPAAAALRDGRAYFHESRSAVVARFPDMGATLAAAGLSALADLPLFGAGRPIGTLALAWSHGRVLETGDRSWLAAVAEVVAVALVRAGAPLRADALTEGL